MLSPAEIERHNEEAKAVWAAYHAGDPIRVPVILETDSRFFLLDNEELNPDGRLSYEVYSNDANIMMDFQLKAAEWRAFNVAPYCDDPAGMPEKFTVTVDTQRYFDAGFFGAPVKYFEGQTPDTEYILDGDKKNLLFDQGLPDPLTGGVFAHFHQLYEVMDERIQRGFTYKGRPVELAPFGLGTDGPITVATNLRGTELYMDCIKDPDYVHQLLDFIVEGTIARIRAHRRFFGLPERTKKWAYADDNIEMISTKMVREFALPAHRKLNEALATGEWISIHLCGNATHHFKLLRDELGVKSFDTGFPIDFDWVREQVGPDVEILGGPRITLLLQGTPEEVVAETKRILKTDIVNGRFILREANDLAPGTPKENMRAMYETARKYGWYKEDHRFK